MKSFVMTCVFLFSCGLLAAEDMKFLTLLSQPVGSFSRVELLDTSKPAEIFHLNFCNTDYPQGYVLTSHAGITPGDEDEDKEEGNDTSGHSWQKVSYNNSQKLSSCPYDLTTNNNSGTSYQACNSWTWNGKNVAACGMQPVAGQSCSQNIGSYCYTNCRISGNTSVGCYYYADLWTCK